MLPSASTLTGANSSSLRASSCRSRRSTPLRLLRLAQWHRAAIEGAELLEVALAGFRLPLHRRVRMLARAALVVSGAIAARCGRSPGLIYTRRDDEALLTFDGGPRWPSAADGATALLLRTTPDLPAHLVSLARPGGGGADPIAPPVAPAPARSDRPALLPGRLTRAEAPDRHQTEYAKLGCGAHHAFPQARGSSSFHSAIRGWLGPPCDSRSSTMSYMRLADCVHGFVSFSSPQVAACVRPS